jgi:16S rRNA (cytosine1402-N4)-methyltransferase
MVLHMRHTPVLAHEILDVLALEPGMHVVDGTLGDGGHAQHMLQQTAPNGRLLGVDLDPEAITRAASLLRDDADRVTLIRESFAHIDACVKQHAVDPVHAILLDLGWSTPQFEQRGRGFSFQRVDEPLDMRLSGDANKDLKTAADLLSTLPAQDLAQIFKDFGEEKLAQDIANAIVDTRKNARLSTVGDLVAIILDVYRKKLKSKKDIPWVGGLHPATKVFQALRIAVNHELTTLEAGLQKAVDLLAPNGRLAVISFHSLEDRIVKHCFKSFQKKNIGLILTKKPVTPSDKECSQNPRARSAKLRAIKKL